MATPERALERIHASAVAVEGRAVLILGASGAGKSSLALELMALGADLVADDQVRLVPSASLEVLRLTAPTATAGLIEARGIGLIRVPHVAARAHWVVTLDEVETERLPVRRDTVIAGVTLPLLRKVESPAFPSMILAVLSGGRATP